MDTGSASPGKHRYHTRAYVLFAVGWILLVLAFLTGTSDGAGQVLAEAMIIVISVDSAAGMPAH